MTTTAEHALPTAAPRAELRALTGLRIVAAAWVVLFHFHFTALPGVATLVALLGPLVTAGALGVDLFFVLSGFVIAYTYLEKLGPRLRARETGRFVWARACRIWPAYALVFHMFGIWLLARAVYGTDPDIAFQGVQPVLSGGEWLQQVFMVQLWGNSFFDGASWVGSTWSISAEWLAYLLFPLVAVVFHRMRNLPFVVLAGGAVALMTPIALAYLATGSPYYPWSWLVRILCGFGGGIMAYLAVRRLRVGARERRIASRVATAMPVLIAVGLLAGELVGPGRGGAVILLFPVLVGALAIGDRGIVTWLSRPAMVHGGRISYALYLIHIPMFEVYWLALRRFGGYSGDALAANGMLAHVVGLAVVLATVPAAHLLYRWVEEPARAAMKDLPTVTAARLRRGRVVLPVQEARGSGPLAGLPVPADDPQTAELPVVVPVTAELQVAMSEVGDWPQRPIDTDEARRDPETRMLPLMDPPTERIPAVRVPPFAVPAASVPDAGHAEVPAQPGPVERVVAARNAELRSPHPELAEQLVGAVTAKGRHRVRNTRPHGAPHIAGQRGPERRGKTR